MKPLRSGLDTPTAGIAMHELMAELYPVCRSITGQGVRTTLERIGKEIPLESREVQTGTQVLDWTIPKEWNIRDAYVKDSSGRRVIDFNTSNLHVLNYSVPIDQHMSLDELRPLLFSDPDHPDWIPYRTSYYEERWGFCIEHNRLVELKDGTYEVRIDSTLEDGSLTFGECFIPGSSDREILISTHVCHPSMCNDNLSGVVVATYLARQLLEIQSHYSYRFLFVPGTIGSITWLSLNEDILHRISAGLVLACLGDAGPPTYKRSRRSDAEIDRAAAEVFHGLGHGDRIENFVPYGYDERQYCSPGFNLPVGCLTRTPFERFPEYHTSGDNLEFVRPEALGDSLELILRVFEVLENNRTYINLSPRGEPRLGARGLYRDVGGAPAPWDQLALLWVLNLSDGDHSLLDVAERSGIAFESIATAADALVQAGLLEERS
jgi:aminopeptidase-like protein